MKDKTHTHHKIAVSRGGTDDEWNLVELDPYTHAYEHALDFVLFAHAPQFDFRHEAWPLLPNDLREAVLAEHKIRFTGKPRSPDVRLKISKSKTGIPNTEDSRKKMSLAKTGDKNPRFGKKFPEHSEKMTGSGNPKSKKVKVIHPDGSFLDFSCTKEAGVTLSCAPSSVSRWARQGHIPHVGRFAGYIFQYSESNE